MDRILEKVANVFGSVGIAALAVAILLVPYADLNAAATPSVDCPNAGLCNNGCQTTSCHNLGCGMNNMGCTCTAMADCNCKCAYYERACQCNNP